MTPLLTARPSVAVALRLLAATGATALAAVIVAAAGGGTASSAAACLAIACVCAALVAHMMQASARAVSDPRLGWICAGVTVAFAGLVCSLLASSALFPGGGLVIQDPDAAAARYLIWHAALVAAGALALVLAAPRRRDLLGFGGVCFALLALTAVSAPVGGFVDAGGYTALLRWPVAAIALAQAGVAFAWWRRSRGAPSWVELCVLAGMGLGALDALSCTFASQPYSNAWWGSLALRAGQFAIPAVGLLLGFVAVADRLRDFEDELAQTLLRERKRALAEEEHVSFDRRRRERIHARLRRLIDGEGLHVAFQPIVDLASGEVVGAEALARFAGADGEPIPTERCFLDAHAVDLGVDLELAVIRLALECEGRLPGGRYLALNVSPAVVEHDGLVEELRRRGVGRPLVVELTEHQPVEDYAALGVSLDRLRELGIRVAVDDVGSGFASFRHVTRVNPDILKLDRTLVRGIDDDPVRQSLASAIVAFARDVGATVVSEGIESESELCCLKDLAVGCGQGFYLARPHLGAVAAQIPELIVVG